MTKIGARLAVLSLITGLAVLTTAQAQEKKIKREELPPAVEKTVAEQSQGATIKGFSTEVEHGQKLYEASLIVNGHTKNILIDRNGNVVEVEEQVTLDSLPSTVQDSLKRMAGSGTVSPSARPIELASHSLASTRTDCGLFATLTT